MRNRKQTWRVSSVSTSVWPSPLSRGSPKNPLSLDEVTGKFMDCAQLKYSIEQSRRILEGLMGLETVENVREVTALFLKLE